MAVNGKIDSWGLIAPLGHVEAAFAWQEYCRSETGFALAWEQAARLLLEAPHIAPRLGDFVDDATGTMDLGALLRDMKRRGVSRNLIKLVGIARELADGRPVEEPVGDWMSGLDPENAKRLLVALLLTWLWRDDLFGAAAPRR